MKKLLTFLFAVTLGINLFAADFEIGTGGTTTSLAYMPIMFQSTTYNSISQQLYYAEELIEAGAGSGSITAISFYYMSSTAKSRTCEVWINEVTKNSIASSAGADQWMYGVSSTNPTPGTKVFDGTVSIPAASGWYTITFTSAFSWGGTKNIIITVNDKTDMRSSMSALNHKVYTTSKTNKPCGIYNTGESESSFDASNTYNLKGTAVASTPVIKFTIETASAPSTPSDFAVSATTSSSATLSWSAVSGATSYDLEQSADGSAWTTLASAETGTSFEWTGLSAESTQYVRIRATNAAGNSDWSDAVTVTTDAVHSHDGITFTKWSYTNSMPLSGNYYLANDVTITAVTPEGLSGNLNLCLNGHTLAFTPTSGCIQIGADKTLAIYDAVGGGLITSPNGTATIQVASNGSLAIHGGMIENSDGNKAIKASAGLDAAHLSIDVSDAKDNSAYFNLVSTSGGLVKDPADGSLDLRVNTNRSFTSAQYNTLCLPFPITDAQLSSIFGSGYDLEKFESASLDGEELTLTFTKVSNLEAGKPYLIKPAHDVANMSHPWSNIAVSEPVEDDSNPYISFHGTFKPTELEGGNKNLLFLGAGNELFWPESTGNLKGFRAYFEVKGAAQKATRARISKKEDHTTDIGDVRSENANAVRSEKMLRNGQILIKRDGKTYNVLGSQIR